MRSFALEYDRDCGIDKRTGWSVKRDGLVLVALEPWLFIALLKAVRTWRRWSKGD